MNTEVHFNKLESLEEQISFVLSKMPKASVDEITMEIMELKGIASEEGVAELAIEVESELEKMLNSGQVKAIVEADRMTRYLLMEAD